MTKRTKGRAQAAGTHLCHIEGVEEPYAFVDVDGLIRDFAEHVGQIVGDAAWPRR